MLVGADRFHLGRGAFLEGRQAGGVVLVVIRSGTGLVVTTFFIGRDEAIERYHLARGAKAGLAVRRLDIDRRAVHPRGLHLAGDHPLPDQLIQSAQIVFEPHGVGVTRDIGRPDRLVGLLGVLGLDLVVAGLGRDIGGAEPLADHLARLGDALRGHIDAVGPHVGDQAALIVDALVQLLRRLHGALGREAQLARRFLLQGRGGEGGRGIAPDRLLLDRGDLELARLDRGARGAGGRLVLDVQTLNPFAGVLHQPRGEGRAVGGQIRLDGPVFLRLEPLDLHLAVDHDAQGNRLDPSGRAGPG